MDKMVDLKREYVEVAIGAGYSEDVRTGETVPVVVIQTARPQIPMTVYQAKQFRDFLDKQIERAETLPPFEEVRDKVEAGGGTIERFDLLPEKDEAN